MSKPLGKEEKMTWKPLEISISSSKDFKINLIQCLTLRHKKTSTCSSIWLLIVFILYDFVKIKDKLLLHIFLQMTAGVSSHPIPLQARSGQDKQKQQEPRSPGLKPDELRPTFHELKYSWPFITLNNCFSYNILKLTFLISHIFLI